MSMGQPLGLYSLTSGNSSIIIVDYEKQLDKEEKIKRNLDAPGKDTIVVPDNRCVIIRFRTNNMYAVSLADPYFCQQKHFEDHFIKLSKHFRFV